MAQLNINGIDIEVDASADTPLLYVLSDELQLKGSRFGCGLAQCGSCSVLVDGVETRACITPISALANKTITTLEGITAFYAAATGQQQIPQRMPLQDALIDEQALEADQRVWLAGQMSSTVRSALKKIKEENNG